MTLALKLSLGPDQTAPAPVYAPQPQPSYGQFPGGFGGPAGGNSPRQNYDNGYSAGLRDGAQSDAIGRGGRGGYGDDNEHCGPQHQGSSHGPGGNGLDDAFDHLSRALSRNVPGGGKFGPGGFGGNGAGPSYNPPGGPSGVGPSYNPPGGPSGAGPSYNPPGGPGGAGSSYNPPGGYGDSGYCPPNGQGGSAYCPPPAQQQSTQQGTPLISVGVLGLNASLSAL